MKVADLLPHSKNEAECLMSESERIWDPGILGSIMRQRAAKSVMDAAKTESLGIHLKTQCSQFVAAEQTKTVIRNNKESKIR